jgi:putative AdoMet-dependent methyltransferase
MPEDKPSTPSNPFPPSEFDAWAASYDESTSAATGFPFEGYNLVLDTILKQSDPIAGDTVLDLGTGTGNLAVRFLDAGCRVWGIDFSGEMLVRARQKLPEAIFAQTDLRGEWPPEFQRRYNRIVSAYTFHHFPLPEKVRLVARLIERFLKPGGTFVIADIAFQDAAEEDQLRQQMGEEWEDEFYWLADETIEAFREAGIGVEFTKVSSCAGVFRFKKGR